jgi:glycosyltransferase involved in cell wall biosynthesis
MRILVVMLTYRRPGDLADVLPALVEHVAAVPGTEILVVDNDTEPSAQACVEEWTAAHPVRYVHEPRPGIAAARNRGLDEAADADLLVFIDDDERPEPGWLSALIATHEAYRTTGVAGWVRSTFDGDLDPWIRAGGWFDRARRPTGSPMPVVATNNLLLDMAQVRRLGVRFDDSFGLTGGSDTVFSLEVGRRGGSFVWCDEAVAVDVVPASRATRRWVVRRAFRSGNGRVRSSLHVAHGPLERVVVRAQFLGRGLARIGGGGLRLVLGLVLRDIARQSRGVRTIVRGAGMTAGAFGQVVSEYARPASTAGSTSPTLRTSNTESV